MSQFIRLRSPRAAQLRVPALLGCVSLAALLGCSDDIVNLGEGTGRQPTPLPTPPSYSRCVDSPTLAGDVLVDEQAQLDALQGCETIEGDVTVQPFFYPDLRPLHDLKVVGGTLTFGLARQKEWTHEEYELASVVSGNWLESFEGLEALENVGNLTIEKTNAPDLAPLSGLRALTAEGALSVTGGNLRNLAPLAGLQGIRSLYVYGERVQSIADLQLPPTLSALTLGGEQLTELGSIRQLRRVDGYVELAEMPLHDLTSFSALEVVGEILLRNMPVLENLNGLEQLTDAGKGFVLSQLPLLDNIAALSSLRHVEALSIGGNPRLRQVPDFSALGPLRSLSIIDNPLLEEIGAFSGILANWLTRVSDGTSVRIPTDPLNTILRRPDLIRVNANPSLRSFSMPVGWEGGKVVEIRDNRSLESLDFVELQDVDRLTIYANPKLRSIALGALAHVDSLVVHDNPTLSPSIFDTVQTFERQMSGNAGTPSTLP